MPGLRGVDRDVEADASIAAGSSECRAGSCRQGARATQVAHAAAISEKARLAAEIGPIRYVAVSIAGSGADLEAAVWTLTLAVVLVLDRLAVVLLLGAAL